MVNFDLGRLATELNKAGFTEFESDVILEKFTDELRVDHVWFPISFSECLRSTGVIHGERERLYNTDDGVFKTTYSYDTEEYQCFKKLYPSDHAPCKGWFKRILGYINRDIKLNHSRRDVVFNLINNQITENIKNKVFYD